MPAPYTITLIGCGKMGGAMLSSWIENNLIKRINIIDPTAPNQDLLSLETVNHINSYSNQIIKDDILILAVKPQILKDASFSLAKNTSKETTILSIAAGQSIKNIESIFTTDHPIIRTMPNTPASIGKGMNVAIANAKSSDTHKNMAEDLLNACGVCQWIEEESIMDAVTALSGSGPAYVFHLIEMLANSGENIGLTKDMAMTLARQTVIGSAALAEITPDIKASELRNNVTSPGGTTQAALDTMMDGRMQNIMDEVLSAAKNRSKELNS